MKVLVTGAAGFIGSNFLYLLADQRPEWEVVAFDLLTYAGNLKNIAPLLNKNLPSKKNISFQRGDICDLPAVSALCAENHFDAIVHFAAESHVDRSILSGAEFVRTNVLGTQVLLDAARGAKIGRFVHISTDEVYGSLGPTGRFLETTPLDPSSPYSASKAGSDLLALAYAKTHGLHVMVTRCTNNYGPYQFPEKLIPLFVTNAVENQKLPLYGDGLNVRSWIHVTDHNEAVLAVLEKGRPGEVYNIGPADDGEVNNRQVTTSILEILGKPQSLIQPVADRLAHDRRYAVDASKIQQELGWKPRIAFASGLAATVKWYLENEAWWREIKAGTYREYYEKNYCGR